MNQNRDVLVCIFLRGGIDGISAIVPYGERNAYYAARPTQAVQESDILKLDDTFGMHPAMSPLHTLYGQGKLAVVHAVGSPDPTRSHFDAQMYMESGTPGNKGTDTGWLGRHLQSAPWANDSAFRGVSIGPMMADSLLGAPAPLSLQSLADFRVRARPDEAGAFVEALRAMYDAASPGLKDRGVSTFGALEAVKSLNVVGYQPANGAVYPNEWPSPDFGPQLMQAAQLIKANVGVEAICIDFDGWDTHENQGTQNGIFSQMLGVFSRGIAAFYIDMGGAMQNVSIVIMSEFGRRVEENASRGTDHGHGCFMLLAGGGVIGGQVHANWPTLDPDVLDNGDLAITTDYRDVLADILGKRTGGTAFDRIFPGHTVTPLNLVRPI